MKEQPAVTRFRDYLRCDTMHPNPDYTTAVAFLQSQAEEIGLDFNVIKPGDVIDVVMSFCGVTSLML